MSTLLKVASQEKGVKKNEVPPKDKNHLYGQSRNQGKHIGISVLGKIDKSTHVYFDTKSDSSRALVPVNSIND